MTKATVLLLPLCFFLAFSSCLVMPASTQSTGSTVDATPPTNGTLTDSSNQSPEAKIAPVNQASLSSSLNFAAIVSGASVGIIGFGLLIYSNKHGNKQVS
jgi:hypothetical protein